MNWQNLPGGASYSTLTSLTDTLIADGSNFLVDKQILKYDVVAQKWVNSRIASINEIQDVDTSTAAPTNGQTLVWDNTNSLWKPGTISSGLTTLLSSSAPATASSTGTAGDITYDADYVYICIATDTWKRAALATW